MNLSDAWITSDTHFFHKNIIKFCNRPENHDEIMINKWQSLIVPGETVLHLGDVFMSQGSEQKAKILLPTLNGNKFMIRGNHDKKSNAWFNDRGFQVVGEKSRLYLEWEGKRILFSHYPDTIGMDWDINVHGHIHNGGYAPGTPKRDYRNVCVEQTGYAPQRVRDVLDGIQGTYQARATANTMLMSTTLDMMRRGKVNERFCEVEALT